MDKNSEILYRKDWNGQYRYPAHIFGLNYYRPGSQGDDSFSRREVWFYYLGDKEMKDEFGENLEFMLENLCVNNSIDWDTVTLNPGLRKDEVNENMLEICREACSKTGMNFRQVLRRTRNVEESHEMQGSEEKIANLHDSVEVNGDVEGSNVVVVDNVSVSGFQLSLSTEKLLDAGAKRVCCICLGITNTTRNVEHLEKGTTASSIMDDGTEEEHQ